MKVAVLTSSRADYSIYYPLLKKIQADKFFSLSIIAFGTHVSKKHGYTIRAIEKDGFSISHALKTFPSNDKPQSITQAMAKTMAAFPLVWETSDYDVVFCLGDRFEMFAACASGVPYNIKFAHIHGGEQTLGAIDDAFRHSITQMADLHFTAAGPYRNRVIDLKGSAKNVFNVGSLSIDNLKNLPLLGTREFKSKFNIDLSIPSILITVHPETVSFEKNELYINEVIRALKQITGFQFIITMPNADTMGNLIRIKLNEFIRKTSNAIGVESFGTIGYLSCMKHCSFMLGNTSSGYIEASYFPKYVIDLGNRQKGRIITPNIYRCPMNHLEITKAITNFKKTKLPSKIRIYGRGNSSAQIVKILKSYHG
jgi:GDP/UDP-N,N'-diacetylbacillosamine 2-epimerase (hydrolysing)